MTRRGFYLLHCLVLALLFFGGMSVQAGDSNVRIELNKLEPQGDACRAYLVLQNGTDSAFASLKLDLVMFDTDGVVAKRLAVETAPLPAGKTSLKVFDMKALACERVGRLLLNTIMKCADASGDRENCLDSIATAARGSVPFIK
ncbi:MAG: Tat pathway signal sequence domain protein [Alphaproteobacteria bacterium]|nr:Tat pathway signal sequence domain protein [Alphaproteobacteria bacterium]